MYDRKGSLFIPNFKRKAIKSDSYLTNVTFYIHHNPIHHGFVKTIDDWPHSSFHALVSAKETTLHRKYVLEWFGNKKELKIFHSQPLSHLNKLELELT